MKRRNEQAITLISLVITIIIMLILVGVVIVLVVGDNGLINLSKDARNDTNKQAAIEKINLKITNSQMNSYGRNQDELTLQDLANDFCEDEEIEYVELNSKKLASLSKIEIGENKSFFTKLKEYPYEFEINNLLEITSIDGEKVGTTNIIQNMKNVTFFDESRNECIIPEGITEVYVLYSTGTNSDELNCSISGSIIKSKEQTAHSTVVENHGSLLRVTSYVYKLNLTGKSGTINITASGGSGSYRAWTAIVMY